MTEYENTTNKDWLMSHIPFKSLENFIVFIE